jgi:hypothetical protein
MSNKKLNLSIDVPVKDLIEALGDAEDDALINLIKDLDGARASWEFTLKLCDYFAAQRGLYDSERAAEEREEHTRTKP